MWTVIEQPHRSPVPSLVNGAVVRHLVEDGQDETVCGEPITGQVVGVRWRRAADRCPACEQTQGVD